MNEEKLLSTQEVMPETARALNNKKSLLALASGGGLLILIIILILVAILLPSSKNSKNTNGNNLAQREQPVVLPTAVPTPTPTPTPMPLPTGPQTYSVSSSNAIQVKQFYVSALDTKVGDSQTMRLTMQDSKSVITSVSVKLITDTKSEIHAFALSSGSATDGVWEGTWKTDDTHDLIYQAEFTIKDAGGDIFSPAPSFR